MNALKNAKVLVLAGPTWMPIDEVRVITNIFSGELGLLIARKLYRLGAKVTLVFGPGRRELIITKQDRFKIIFFNFFDELLKIAKSQSPGQQIIINSSAIADYQPLKKYPGKIKSGQKDFCLYFKPTPKIIDLMRKINPAAVLVKFKLEVGKSKKELLKIAYQSLLASKADFIVANDLSKINNNSHRAFILDKDKCITISFTKKEIVRNLIKQLHVSYREKFNLK